MTWSRLPLGIAALGIIGCAIGLVLVPVELARLEPGRPRASTFGRPLAPPAR